jgi:DNA invertase Pin-like site-specific DNA recombinase
MKVIYGRISTASQNMERQMQKEGKCFLDVCSGGIPFFERTQSNAMMHYIRTNGIKDISVAHLDRLGRNTRDVLNTIHEITKEGVNIRIEGLGLNTLDENGKPNPITEIVIQVLSMVARMENNIRRERQEQGIAIAKAKKQYKGKPMGATMKDESIARRYASRLVIYQSMLNGGDSLLKIEKCTKGKDIAINRATLKALIVKGMLIKPERIKTKQRDEKLNLMK